VAESIDILMITYNRPEYTRLALERLLSTCDEEMRVWVWQNASHEATLDVVRSFLDHPRLYRFHHSQENVKVREPTNWLWTEAEGAYLTKVDDDCLLPVGWAETLRTAHRDVPQLGIVGCWRFHEEDFDPAIASWKIQPLPGGHRILRNHWLEGSGYLMKRAVVEQGGLLPANEVFTAFCWRASAQGWINGWYYPFIYQEHMDDPRSPHCLIRDDDDLRQNAPLSALNFGITTVEQRVEQIRQFAREVQTAPIHPRAFVGWRGLLRRVRGKLRRMRRRGMALAGRL
jgi:GT2 family glycosyltransferase